MRRRERGGSGFDDLLAFLLLVPWWVGPVVAVAAFVAVRVGIGLLLPAGSATPTPLVGLLLPWVTWAAMGMVMMVWGVSMVIRVFRGAPGTGGERVEAGGRKRVYFAQPHLMTGREVAFYRVLVEAVAGKYVVMTKVRLADLLEVRTWKKGPRNQVNQKHVDFVLLDAGDLRVRLVVELDDSSHGSEEARGRDGVKDGALREAGVKLLRVKAAAGYRVGELAGEVGRAVG